MQNGYLIIALQEQKLSFIQTVHLGPLGRPTAQKISEDEEVRNWDPTDPDTNNPWKNYVKKSKEENIENNKSI